MLRGWRSVPCVYPVLSVVWLLSPFIFLTLSIYASAPSNIPFSFLFFFSKICASRDRDERDAHILGSSLSLFPLSLSFSLYTYLLSFSSRTAFLPSGPLLSFQYSLGWVATLPCFAFAIASASLAFFLGFGDFLASGGTRVLEPLRDTSVISKSGLGHPPCRGEDSGKRAANQVFHCFFFAVAGLVCCW